MLVKPTRGAVLNPSHPLARGVVAYWLFNEGAGGKVFDLSRYGNTGELFGGSQFTAGAFGSALEFDGTDDMVKATDPPDVSGSFTVIAYTFCDDISSGNRCIIGTRSPSEYGIDIKYAGTQLLADVGDGSSWLGTNLKSGVNTVTAGAWYHSAFVADPDGWQYYINAIAKGSGSWSGTPVFSDANHQVVIGSYRLAGSEYFIGRIDHIIVYNRALSASEIAWLYREPFAMISIPSPPLVVISAGGIINAEGQIDGTSSASSTATVDWVAETSVSGTSSVTPDATVEWSAAVDVDAASTVTPDAVVDWGAVVDIDATSAVTPDAVVEWGAATQVDGESGLTVGAVVDWAAETTIGATSSVTPGATVDWGAATQIDATSSLTGTASIGEVFVEGTIDATSSVTVGAIVDWAAETSIAAAATVAADLTGLFLLEVSIAAVSSLTGTAQIGLLHSASGTISAVTSIIGTLRNTRDANWTADTSTTSITWQNVSEDNDITWTLE